MSLPHKVAVYLQHPQVRAWSFSSANREHFLSAYPGSNLVICQDSDSFKTALNDAEGAIVWHFKQDWFPLAPSLKWIATPAAGREYLHVEPPAGVRLFFGSFHGELIGETVLGLILGHCRGLFAATQIRDHPWPRKELTEVMRPLRGSHLVILGYGHIGRWISRLAKPFGARITGIRKQANPGSEQNSSDPVADAADRVISISDLESVLPDTDHLVLALPGGAGTELLLNARRLSMLPAHAAIYNIGRGNSIDEQVLAALLMKKKIAGAYLDVFAEEPLPVDSPLRQCSNAILLPHISAVAPNYLDLFIEELVQRLKNSSDIGIQPNL